MDPTHIKISISKLFMCNMSRQGSNHWYDAVTLFKTSVNVVLKFTTSRTTIRWNISRVAMLHQTLNFHDLYMLSY